MRIMSNLLQETIEAMDNYGPEDIVYIGVGRNYACTWDEFKELADFDYDSGWGSAKINTGLVIRFDDGTWLSRGEYDGSEWWEWNYVPEIPEKVPRKMERKHLLESTRWDDDYEEE